MNYTLLRTLSDYEFSITNEIIQKERYRTFIKVPELVSFYAEVWELEARKGEECVSD